MSALDKIKGHLKYNRVVLYIKGTEEFPQCGYSSRVIQILKGYRAKCLHINVVDDPKIRETLKEYSNWPTYPQLYIDGELIGGCDIVVELHQKGELIKMLAAADAIKK